MAGAVMGARLGCAETDYPVWTYVTVKHISCSCFLYFLNQDEGAELCACVRLCDRYLEDSSYDEHRLVRDLRVLGATIQSVSKLPAGFGPSRAPEDAPGVRPLSVQVHQHVLRGTNDCFSRWIRFILTD